MHNIHLGREYNISHAMPCIFLFSIQEKSICCGQVNYYNANLISQPYKGGFLLLPQLQF